MPIPNPAPVTSAVLLPGTYDDFFEQVVPLLQDRGVMQSEYATHRLQSSSQHLTREE